MTPCFSKVAILLVCAAAVPAAAQEEQTGLAALSDQSLYSELASRGLESLLDRAFEQNKVPLEERRAFKVLSAVRELSASGSRMSQKQRDEAIDRMVKGIEQSMLAAREPKVLLQQAGLLIEHAILPDMNTLEYWGENERLQADLRPVAELVIRIYDKAIKDATTEAAKLEKQITSAADTSAGRQWEEMDALVATATYTRHMSVYYLTATLNKDDPKRSQMATESIDYLKQFDNPESGVQAPIRNRMAKLNMTRGDYRQARELFSSVTDDKAKFDPPADLSQQYEAMYFAAQSALLEGDTSLAHQRHAALLDWQRKALPSDEGTQAGADAAARVLEYRINAAEAERATDPNLKQAANDKAIEILMGLLRDRPELRTMIYQQLLDRLPDNPDMTKLDPLMLRALIGRGEAEVAKPPTEPVDQKQIEKATNAARELMNRKGQAGVEDETVDLASLRLGFFLQKLGRTAESAEAFITYAESHPANLDRTKAAMDMALAAVAELRKTDMQGTDTARITDRFLPLAIDKFGRNVFAYEYARRLQLGGEFAKAIEYYRKVPADDARALEAKFFELQAHKQLLDSTDDQAARSASLAAVDRLGQQMPAQLESAISKADANKNQVYRSMLARTQLVLADLARRERQDGAKVVQMLADFEQVAAGLPGEPDLLGEALFLRVNAYMQLGRTTEATKALVALLEKRQGNEGIQIVVDLLRRLGEDLDLAKQAGDIPAMRTIAANRAQLSGFLVDWAQGNSDERIRRFSYRYRVSDASTKYLAASLTEDPAAREKALRDTLALYETLQLPENVELYKQTLENRPGVDPNYGDPAVMFGIAQIHFELSDYQAAQPILARLLNDRKLGLPTTIVSENGQDKVVENALFWEATYKLYRSNVEMAKAGAANADILMNDTKSALRRQYVQWGRDVGGKRWGQEFEKLRQEIVPEFEIPRFTEPSVVGGAATTAPTQ